jgi:Zn finger protein HypA/HybF involved in hydrogenase expression
MIRPNRRTSKIWQYTKEEFQELLYKASTLSEALTLTGYPATTGYYKTLRQRVAEDNADVSHMTLGRGHNKGKLYPNRKKTKLEDIMVENSTFSTGHLKERLIKEGILENRCALCQQLPEWCGKKLVMILDHINGVNNDHRIDNLRLLCPNCNSQTDTFSRGSKVDKKAIVGVV